MLVISCLLYTSDAADEKRCVDLGGRRIIKKNFFQAEDGIRDRRQSRGLGDVYKRQDKGGTAKALKEYMPNMHLAVIYAKPRGLPLANTYVEEITQETWPVFPWDEEDKANH